MNGSTVFLEQWGSSTVNPMYAGKTFVGHLIPGNIRGFKV